MIIISLLLSRFSMFLYCMSCMLYVLYWYNSVSPSVLSDMIFLVLVLSRWDVMSLFSLISTQSLCGESLTCESRKTQWSWIYLFSLFSLQQSVKFTFGLISHFSHHLPYFFTYALLYFSWNVTAEQSVPTDTVWFYRSKVWFYCSRICFQILNLYNIWTRWFYYCWREI